MEAIKRWFNRQLSNPQVALLGVLLLIGFAVIFFFGSMLTPFFAAVIIAYLLDGIVMRLQRHHIPRLLAVTIVFSGFVVVILLIAFGVIPSVVNQLQSFALRDVPRIIRAASVGLETVQTEYNEFRMANFADLFSQKNAEETAETDAGNTNELQTVEIDLATGETTQTNTLPVAAPPLLLVEKNRTPEPVNDFPEILHLTNTLEEEISNLGRTVVTTSINSFKNLVVWIVYLVLVPVLVFFLLKDKDRILNYLIQFMPHDRSLATQIWHDVNIQTSNYIRGKFWEIIIVWSVSHATFTFLGLNSALLLSLFVGLSVMVPYLGAALMYIPITLVAFYQFGWGSMLFWVLVAYSIIQILDGNVLAPILLSEVTSLHPVAVIISILIFGGLWGFWGVFFAIPLATLVNAVIKAWPTELAPASLPTSQPSNR